MGLINVVSVGWSIDDITLGAVKWLQAGLKVFLKTARCEAAEYLDDHNISYESFDRSYDEAEDFDDLTETIRDVLIDASRERDIVFCVNDPGDEVSAALCAATPDIVRLHGGACEGSALIGALGSGVRRLCAADIAKTALSSDDALVINEIDTPLSAGEVKLALMELWPDSWPVICLDGDGRVYKVPLYELDRLKDYSHLTSVAIAPIGDLLKKERFAFSDLMKIMDRLLAFDGCPWDREQTHKTLAPYLIEEAYEAIDAINEDDPSGLCEELGDVLYQIVFHAHLGEDHGEFSTGDMITGLCQKIIRRHPHVFGDLHCDTADEVKAVWDAAKAKEKAYTTPYDKLDRIARALPALMRATKVIKALDSYQLPDASRGDDIGEALYALAAKAYREHIDPEGALAETVERRILQARRMDDLTARAGQDVSAMTRDELLRFWEEAGKSS